MSGAPRSLLGVLLLVACGASSTPASVAPPPPVSVTSAVEPSATSSRGLTTFEANAMRRLIRAAEAARDLTFVRPPLVAIESAQEIAAHADAELDPAELEIAQRLYRGLGLLPAELDLRAHLRELLTEQVLGYYDTDRARLVVRDEVAQLLASRPGSAAAAEARLVVVHELVHALQDQRLGLAASSELKRGSDADTAFHALVEGDATYAMLLDLATTLRVPVEQITTDAAVEALVGSAPDDGALARAPPIVRVGLVMPYLAGLGFVRALHARGGWRAVDEAFHRLPRSTEQILHPDSYLRDEAPEEVALPPLEGWRLVHEDTLGELELSVFLARDTGRDLAPEAARGWGGDRVGLYEGPEGREAIVWITTWDDEAAAARVERALRRTPRPEESVHRHGRSIAITRHLPAPLVATCATWIATQPAETGPPVPAPAR